MYGEAFFTSLQACKAACRPRTGVLVWFGLILTNCYIEILNISL
jgi:hypothetical protein